MLDKKPNHAVKPDKLLRHPNWMVREYAVQHCPLSQKQIELALNDVDEIRQIVIARYPVA